MRTIRPSDVNNDFLMSYIWCNLLLNFDMLTVNDIAFVMDSKVCTNTWEYCVSVYVVIS